MAGHPRLVQMRSVATTLIVVAMGIVGGCTVLNPPIPTPLPTPTPSIVRVTASEVAAAMQQDRFFAEYGQATLLVQGTVASVSQQNGREIVDLRVGEPTKVLCDLASPSVQVRDGATITVRVQGGDARREQGAVVLANCVVQ
jgi:hypothetical protein